MGLISNPIPQYKIGDWWVVETHIIEDISDIEHGPEILGDKIYYHKYEVVGEAEIDATDVWLIDIKAENIPPEFANDHGNHYLWRLFLDKKNITLVRFEESVRSQRYLVSDSNVIQGRYDYKKGNPVVMQIPSLTPLYIPRLPHKEEFPRFLEEDEKEFEFVDERTNQEFVQYIVAIEEKIKDQSTIALYITLYNEELGIQTQKWVPGLPWWQEWRCSRTDRFSNGMWYAKLIEWGKANSK